MFKFIRETKGSVTVIVAVGLVALLGITALVSDGGYLFSRRTGFQDIADASALAAAMELSGNGNNEQTKKNKAFQAAKKSVEKNRLLPGSASYPEVNFTYGEGESGKMVISFPNGIKQARIDMNISGKTFFAKVLGYNAVPVSVRAVAEVGQPSQQTGGIIPVSVIDDPDISDDGNFTQWTLYEMTFGPGGGVNGNYGWISFDSTDDTSGNTMSNYLQNGYPEAINIGEQVFTHPGVMVGIASTAIGNRLSGCSDTFNFSGKTPEQVENEITQHLHIEPDCTRLVYTPIVDSITTPVVQGFAAYFIESYQHVGNYITLRGVFINQLGEGDVIPTNLNYAVQSVRLVE